MREMKMTTQREIDEQTAMNAKFKRGQIFGAAMTWLCMLLMFVFDVPYNMAVVGLALFPIGLLFVLKA